MSADNSALFGVHPSEYSGIAAHHADHISKDEAYKMVRDYIGAIMVAVGADETFKHRERGALYAAYTAHLFVELFQRVYSHAEEDLKTRDQLQRLFESS